MSTVIVNPILGVRKHIRLQRIRVPNKLNFLFYRFLVPFDEE